MPHLNKIRTLWDAGQPVANGWLSMGSAFAAEIYAGAGFDCVTLDLQHGMNGIAEMVSCLQAVRAAGVTPMVRVPSLEPAIISKALDAGALGLICPMISTPEQARMLVAQTKYPPRGERSSGPTRASLIYSGDYFEQADAQIVVIAMIETQEGVDNLDAICRTPGLDAVYIGPSDLTLALAGGRLKPGPDRQEPEMIEAIQAIIAGAHAAGIRAGLHCGSSDYAAKAVGWGADLVTLTADVPMLARAAHATVRTFREQVAAG